MSGFGQPPGGGFGQPPAQHGQPGHGGGFGPQPNHPAAGPPGYRPHGFGAPSEPPTDYRTAGVLMLTSGIMTVMVSMTLFITLIWICVGVFWLLTLGAGIFEIVVAASILQGRPNLNAKTASILGLVGAVLSFNIISIVLEIVTIVNLNKPEVEAYLRS